MWLARDKDNTLYFHGISKPKKDIKRGIWKSDELTPYFINPNFFPEIRWTDEKPTKVKFVIEK